MRVCDRYTWMSSLKVKVKFNPDWPWMSHPSVFLTWHSWGQIWLAAGSQAVWWHTGGASSRRPWWWCQSVRVNSGQNNPAISIHIKLNKCNFTMFLSVSTKSCLPLVHKRHHLLDLSPTYTQKHQDFQTIAGKETTHIMSYIFFETFHVCLQ